MVLFIKIKKIIIGIGTLFFRWTKYEKTIKPLRTNPDSNEVSEINASKDDLPTKFYTIIT